MCIRDRVAAGTRGALGDGKGAKADDGDAAVLLEGGLHTADHRLQGARGRGLGNVGMFGAVSYTHLPLPTSDLV